MNDLLNDAASRADAFLTSIQSRRVYPSKEAVDRLSSLEETLPDHPCDARDVLRVLDEIGSPATVGMAGPRYFGFVIGGALPVTVAANWLAAAWDQNVGLIAGSPVASRLEEVALGWLLDVLGLPAGTAGCFVTGATMANFTALAAARHTVLGRAGWDVESQGLFGAPPVTVIVGDEAHTTLFRALGLLGLGRNRVLRVPVDTQGRMRADAVPTIAGPTILCVQAGNVNSGAFDPAPQICRRAREGGAWVHVDGAFGLWAAATPSRRHLVEGFADADSWATDAHKWLNVPYDSGLAFIRDPESIRGALALSAAYLPRGERREPSEYTPELSRRARGVEIWAALRSLGRSGLAEMIDRTCRHATRFAEGLASHGYSILNDVAINQVLVSFGPPEVTRRVISAIQEDGTCWCGGTVWQGQTAMRISVCSWATTDEDVEKSLDAMLRCAHSAGAR